MKGGRSYTQFTLRSSGAASLIARCQELGLNFSLTWHGQITAASPDDTGILKPLLLTDLYLYRAMYTDEVVLFHSTDPPLVVFTKSLVTLNLEDLSSEKLKHFITVIKLMRR